MGEPLKAMPLATLTTSFTTCQGEELSATCMTDRAGPFTGLHFFKGVSLCESLHPYMAAMNHPTGAGSITERQEPDTG